MKILIVGGGGREHAIAWCLKKSKRVDKLYCAPGNAGIAKIAECVDVRATDVEGVVNFAKSNAVDMVMVAPDDPLYMGMVDALEAAGVRAFGPRKLAAEIEGSKVFAKDMMKKFGIPTAKYEVFDNPESALEYVRAGAYPVVLKADGLALGKGVIIAEDEKQAADAIDAIMVKKTFGDSGNRVVIEEFLQGPEVSVLAFCDGKTVKTMPSAQDHKRAYDFDRGPNTGGMGAFSPSRIYTDEIAAQCEREIFQPTVKAMAQLGRPFKGVLYFGLMITADGPRVIEYNARFGDPETQVVLPKLKTDLVDVFDAVIDGRLSQLDVEWEDEAAVCVVMASGGYPMDYQKGAPIEGIEQAEAAGAVVFHSGTADKDGKLVTAGGRVLGVTAFGDSLEGTIKKAYGYVGMIGFDKAHYRRDIGKK